MSKPNKAKNYVYYGEYSLSHWVNLIETGNIKLPSEYQRNFVWGEENVENLITSFNRNLFVPPVIICRTSQENEQTNSKEIVNLILDGQQRLSSLYLIAKGKYPKKVENDDEDENPESDNVWTLNCLNNKPDLLKDKNYKLDGEKLKAFLDDNYLGFSYLLPDEENIDTYGASIFKEINTTGVNLTIQERRKASLHMYENYNELFKPEFINKEFSIKNNDVFVDFLKMLAFVSLYKKDKAMKNLPVKQSDREKLVFYYMETVYFENKNNGIFDIDILNIKNVSKIQETLMKLIPSNLREKDKYKFNNTEELELYFYGLIYFYIYKNSKMKNDTDYKSLTNKINSAMTNKTKGVNAKSTVIQRIQKSIELYEGYFEDKK